MNANLRPSFSTSPPEDNELEVHVYGQGYGEAALIHYGGGRWIAIDSAVTKKNEPWAIEYLQQIGHSAAQIDYALLTHWHTDHIKGFSKLISQSPNAKVFFSSASRTSEFRNVAASFAGTGGGAVNAASYEYNELIRILSDRKKTSGSMNLEFVSCNTSYSLRSGGFEGRLLLLSPSAADVISDQIYFRDVINQRMPTDSPYVAKVENHSSVVALIEFQTFCLLFGADRELHKDTDRGWNVVFSSIANLQPSGLPAGFYKVSHHGSHTGYCQDLWKSCLGPDAVLVMTPYTRSRLPTLTMVNAYKTHSTKVFSSAVTRKIKGDIRNDIAKLGPHGPKILSSGQTAPGSVRCRRSLSDAASIWSTELFDGAQQM